MPTISVIVPVYKVEKYIHRCVDNILGQTYTSFELILVDDGSPDNCGAICDEYAEKDDRVVVIHQKNGGLSAARNAGIDWVLANSDSEWLTFLDSDDWVHAEYLQHLLYAAQKYNVPVSICGYVQTEGEVPTVEPESLKPVQWEPEEFYVKYNVNATVAWGKLYRKECFYDIRYPVGKIHEDEYTTHCILFRCASIVVIEAPLYFYFTNPSGITKSKWYPEKIQALNALKTQINFYKTHNFTRAQAACVRNCMNCGISQLEAISILPLHKHTKNKYRRKIVHMLAEILRKNIEVFPITENYWIYELVFPRRMKLYWILRAIKKSLETI